jgi:hypothetical protein
MTGKRSGFRCFARNLTIAVRVAARSRTLQLDRPSLEFASVRADAFDISVLREEMRHVARTTGKSTAVLGILEELIAFGHGDWAEVGGVYNDQPRSRLP